LARVLAVDPGSKRVGLAVSDPSGAIAQPLGTLDAAPAATLAARITEVALTQQAERLVVGLPVRLDGSQGPQAAAARALADKLRATAGLPVELIDERLSTAQAERELISGGASRARRRQVRDRVAATLILQAYLARAARGR
jgi:putative Holliday junction resolvase